MTFLPIVERELRVAARRPATHWLRCLSALAALVLGGLLVVSVPRGTSPAELGKLLLAWESVVAMAFCLFAGAFLTADCLSAEKREGTLGLLFLTDLKGYDVVLGKLAATSLLSAYALVAIFPLLGLPLLMGGVTGAEFGRIVLVLLLTLLLSLSVGMAVSAFGRETRQTVAGSLAIMAALAGLGPCLMWLGAVLSNGRSPEEAWLLGSPAGTLFRAFDFNYRRGFGAGGYWLSAGLLLAAALGLLALAGRKTQRGWQSGEGTASLRPWGVRWQRWRWGSPAWRAARRAELGRSPVAWLVRRDRLAWLQAWVVLGFLGALCLGFIGGTLMGGRRSVDLAWLLAVVLCFVMHTAFKVIVALEATRRWSEDKRSGSLELLLTSPLRIDAILQGHHSALARLFRGPMWALLGVNACMFFLITVVNPMRFPATGLIFMGQAFVLGAVALWADFHALSWVGLLQALRSRSQPRAALAALSRILLPPWLGVILFIFYSVGARIRDTDLPGYALVWFLLGFLLSGAHLAWARTELTARFRALAHVEPRRDPGLASSPIGGAGTSAGPAAADQAPA